MASTSDEISVPIAGKWAHFIIKNDGTKLVPNPYGDGEKRKIWAKQVSIPFSVEGSFYSFGGPIVDESAQTKEVVEIFPCHETCEPRIFNPTPYDFRIFTTNYKPFRSAPYTDREDYLSWLNRVEKSYEGFWKDYGIYDLIQFSRMGIQYQTEMLYAAMHFYEKSTNTFQFKCGMMTPTLLDVAAITGLPPTGETYRPENTSKNITFNFHDTAFSNYIAQNQGETDEEVSHEEHVAFLTLWLSHFVFCSKSLQIAKLFIPMAIQIHEGRKFGLGKLILATLYEGLGLACDKLKDPEKQKGFQIAGPIWCIGDSTP